MAIITPVLAFVFVLGIIIFVHEFGHLITAKAFGMRVFIFSFGFGKRLFGFKWGDTDCRVSLVPLGGYVKLEGEGDDLVSEDTSTLGDGKDFLSRPRWQPSSVTTTRSSSSNAMRTGACGCGAARAAGRRSAAPWVYGSPPASSSCPSRWRCSSASATPPSRP